MRDKLFNVENLEMKTGAVAKLKKHKLQIVAAVSGQIEIISGSERGRPARALKTQKLADEPSALLLSAGQFCLIPASLERTEILAKSESVLLRVEAN